VNTSPDLRRRIENLIRNAFHNVTLGGGISLTQAQAIDAGTPATGSGFDETNDWSRIPFNELERDRIAHLDARGFRYYMPAPMLSVLTHYDPASMRVIGTLSALYPKKTSPGDITSIATLSSTTHKNLRSRNFSRRFLNWLNLTPYMRRLSRAH